MLRETVAERYAEALYGLAQEAGRVAAQLGELEQVLQTLERHDRLKEALYSPAVPSSVKRAILRRLLEGQVSRTTMHFLYLLVDKEREVYLPAVIQCYRKRMRREKGVVQCRVQVAAPLSESQRGRLEERLRRLTGRRVELVVEVDPDLLAGAVITYEDQRIDGSLESHLQALKERMIGV